MTVFLIIAIPAAALFGLMMWALCAAASEADRREEELFEDWQREHKEGDA